MTVCEEPSNFWNSSSKLFKGLDTFICCPKVEGILTPGRFAQTSTIGYGDFLTAIVVMRESGKEAGGNESSRPLLLDVFSLLRKHAEYVGDGKEGYRKLSALCVRGSDILDRM